MTALQQARAVLGTAYLSFPALAVRVTGNQAPEATRRVTRVLGARHLLQALATAGQPAGTVLLLGAEADIAHAASMLALGLISRRCRRAALPDALLAASLAAAGIAAARRNPQPAPHSATAWPPGSPGTCSRPISPGGGRHPASLHREACGQPHDRQSP